jgi:hypothetical protein
MVKFLCVHCGHKLKSIPEQAGKLCKCTACGLVMTIPASSVGTAAAPVAPRPAVPANKKARSRLAFGLSIAVAGLLVLTGVVFGMFLLGPRDVDQKLNDLKGAAPAVRQQALVWLAEAVPRDAYRAPVTAALEPLLFEGDVRGDLSPDLLLRAYLHWASPDNVPAMMRMVDSPNLPSWSAVKTGLVMESLGKLQDKRAAQVLAEKLPDPLLRDQAVNALKLMGPGAEDAVLDYQFDDNPDTRLRASQLLASYGTSPKTLGAEALRRLKSNDPDVQGSAAVWYAENPPDNPAQKAAAAPFLARLLDGLSPRVDAVALQALKLWATKDCLPSLATFAQRQQKAAANAETAANTSVLIDVLAQFPDETAAEAIALQLKDVGQRGKAVQALLKLGPVSAKAVLGYLNHPDGGVRKEAQSLSRLLNISADRQLAQTLTDVADASKPRSRAALQHLATLRADDANRADVSRTLNAPLLDPDPGIRADALNAVAIWGTKENTVALVKRLGSFPNGSDPRMIQSVSAALISIGPGAEEAVIHLLRSPEGVVVCEASRILGEIGTDKSVEPLQETSRLYGGVFYNQMQVTIAKIMARK